MKLTWLSLCLVGSQAIKLQPLPWEDYVIIPVAAVAIAMFAGIMSGLTVGLMAIDELNLKLKLESGTDEEKIYARRILPILKDHHLLLVTLLLANAIALETLPLILDMMVGGVAAVIISVILTLFLAEVIPQAICLGPNQIPIASSLSQFVRFIIFVLWPISYPIARLLDKTIGHGETKIYSDKEMKIFFTMQITNKKLALEPIFESQIGMIHKVIDFKEKSIEEIFTGKEQVFAINAEMELNEENLELVSGKGFSRLPIRDEKGVWIGVFKTRMLLGRGNEKKVSDFSIKSPIFVHFKENIYTVLSLFSQYSCHMAFVVDDNENTIGLITLKDIIKELIKKEKTLHYRTSITETEVDVNEKKTEGFFRKIFNNIRRKNHVNKDLIEEFQLAEKDSLKVPLY
ncbi:hypothetical protein SteCoe_26829 [Stentor coeruleus]|uniref:CNNM transmembrane domain-containing protein n=1 Tax=Stentor coeruleus TaxID=5963 RepID=A0A1R2BBY9_9CILI|nr:hypothetical protein SteCoe_26829 [Stentor coeruleus]